MRQFKSLFLVAACVSFASATAVQRWTSSSVDTTTVHVNTNTSSGKIAVGALSTGPNGFGVRAVSSGTWGIGVWGEGQNHGVIGLSGNSGVQGNTYGTSGKGVAGYVDASVQATGVFGQARSGYGVHGIVNGIAPTGSQFVGVFGQATGNNGIGVKAEGHGSGNGLTATSTSGYGVQATSTNSIGIVTSGNWLGMDVSTTNLYSNGINIVPGGRGTGLYTSGGQFGVYGIGTSWDGADRSYGVVGEAYGGDVSYGVTGYASGANGSGNDWAGWFDGAVYVGGYFDNPSDQKFKTNVKDYRGGLDKILALKIKSYDMKVDEFKGRINLPSGPQVGVIAQEAEKVFPELVHNTKAPAKLTAEERKKGVQKKGEEFKSVNYNALIPVLVQAIQELQAEVDALKAAR